MFRTKKTMQQQWDECIEDSRKVATTDLRHADLLEAFSCFRWAAKKRAGAAESTAIADRMTTCPHNPRNGGTGWRDHGPSQFSALDKAFILLRLGYLIVLAGAVMAGVVLLAFQHDPHLADSLPRYLLVNVEALAAAAWALAVTSWAMTGALTAWDRVRGYVRGADE